MQTQDAHRAPRNDNVASPSLSESRPNTGHFISILSGVEPTVMAASWYSDRVRATWLIVAMAFIGALQWLIWTTVAHQFLNLASALAIGLIPPVGLLIFDRLVILPSLWEVGHEAREALAVPPPGRLRQALSLAIRLAVSLAFAWVAAQYLTLAVEGVTLHDRSESERKQANQPLVDEYLHLKEQHYADTVQALVQQRAQLQAEIQRLDSTSAEAEQQSLAFAQAAAKARLEQGREEDGFDGDGLKRVVGRGQNYRDAQRQEAIATEQTVLHQASLAKATVDLTRARQDYERVAKDLAKALELHQKEASRLSEALPNDPRYVKEIDGLLARGLALEKLKRDPVLGTQVELHTLQLEILVIFLDLLLLFVKWAPHNDSYAARLVAGRRLEMATVIREANRAVAELRQERPEIRIVREHPQREEADRRQ